MTCWLLQCNECGKRDPDHDDDCGHLKNDNRFLVFKRVDKYKGCNCAVPCEPAAGSQLGTGQAARRSVSPRVSPSPSATPAQNYRDRGSDRQPSPQPRPAPRPIAMAPQPNFPQTVTPQPAARRVQTIAPRPPGSQERAFQAPATSANTCQQPARQQPARQQSAYQPPAYQQPSYQQPLPQPLAYQPPAQQRPAPRPAAPQLPGPPPLARQPSAPPTGLPGPLAQRAPSPQPPRPELPSIHQATGINYYGGTASVLRQNIAAARQNPAPAPPPQHQTYIDARNANEVNIWNAPNTMAQPGMIFQPPAAGQPGMFIPPPAAVQNKWNLDEEARLVALYDLGNTAKQIDDAKIFPGRKRQHIYDKLRSIGRDPKNFARARGNNPAYNTYKAYFQPASQHPSAFSKGPNRLPGDDDDGSGGGNVGGNQSQPLSAR